jgi:2-keto-3-deoxy-L-rhamnonate aldolase RhmA
MRNKTLGERLTAGETLYGGWNVTGDVIAAGLMAAAGLDYVVVDLQHGGGTERDLPALTAWTRPSRLARRPARAASRRPATGLAAACWPAREGRCA